MSGKGFSCRELIHRRLSATTLLVQDQWAEFYLNAHVNKAISGLSIPIRVHRAVSECDLPILLVLSGSTPTNQAQQLLNGAASNQIEI